ncbi:hypothetical protein SLE2022_218430 [Rubroshorea leprosula]
MATLQKFKLLATQCGVVQSPTRSPRTSPLVHFRRRKSTLRMLLTRTTSRRSLSSRVISNQKRFVPALPPEKKNDNKDSNSRTLKDLFVSSPPFGEEEEEEDKSKVVNEKNDGKSEVLPPKLKEQEVESNSPRPGWVGFRHRLLLRRAWRPMLVSIPE